LDKNPILRRGTIPGDTSSLAVVGDAESQLTRTLEIRLMIEDSWRVGVDAEQLPTLFCHRPGHLPGIGTACHLILWSPTFALLRI
jgi:hypothetical protein